VARDVLAIEPVLAAVTGFEQAQHRQQGRFSAPGRAGDGHVFAGLDVERNMVQGGRSDLAADE